MFKNLCVILGALAVTACSSTPNLDKNFSKSVKSSIEMQRINPGPSGTSNSQVDAIEVSGAYNSYINSKPAPVTLTSPTMSK